MRLDDYRADLWVVSLDALLVDLKVVSLVACKVATWDV